MERKKRRFSGFDIAVVGLVIAAALVWFFVFNRTPQVEAGSFGGDMTTYYIEVQGLTEEQVALVQIGDALQEGARHLPIGQVVAIETRPQEAQVNDNETQTISFQVIPDRVVMILTVETEVSETEQEILAGGEVVLRGGATMHFTGPGYAFSSGVILRVNREV